MADAVIQAINYVVKTPGFRQGEPHIAGRHISVEFIASLYINHGALVEEIADAQELTPAQVHAALAYYYDHQDEIEAIWEAHHEAGKKGPSDEQQAAEMERLIAKMKVENPEKYERFMRAREGRTE